MSDLYRNSPIKVEFSRKAEEHSALASQPPTSSSYHKMQKSHGHDSGISLEEFKLEEPPYNPYQYMQQQRPYYGHQSLMDPSLLMIPQQQSRPMSGKEGRQSPYFASERHRSPSSHSLELNSTVSPSCNREVGPFDVPAPSAEEFKMIPLVPRLVAPRLPPSVPKFDTLRAKLLRKKVENGAHMRDIDAFVREALPTTVELSMGNIFLCHFILVKIFIHQLIRSQWQFAASEIDREGIGSTPVDAHQCLHGTFGEYGGRPTFYLGGPTHD